MKIRFVTVFLICQTALMSQGFTASLLGGFNASQIDGDDLAGFNKFGLHGGLSVGYLIKPKLDLSMELLISQRGSSSNVVFGSPEEESKIQLNYIELPIKISFMDWWVDAEYHKVRADFGLSLAYLFNSTAENSFFEEDVSQFNDTDLSFVAGLGYRFNSKIGVNMRYTRSILPLYNEPDVLQRALYGYLFTFRLEYYL